MQDTPIVGIGDFDYEAFKKVPIATSKKGRKKCGKKYLAIITAFDIETSKIFIDGHWHGYMYIWQWQIGSIATVIGRTWEEFKFFYETLALCIPEDARMMVYVHNLSYEFQYLAGVLDINGDDVFATDLRKPLYFTNSRYEFRCSYRLSNQSLDAWSKELKVDHQKLSGDEFDYNETRYPWTELTADQLAYCVHDVLAVVECVEAQMARYGDTLYTIPYTSTGYVRREVRNAVRVLGPSYVKGQLNDLYVYDLLRKAFRGGDTHANPYEVRNIIPDVYSYDRSSSYPDVMIHCKFPMTKFRRDKASEEMIAKNIHMGRACLIRVYFTDIKIKDFCTCPYISISKTDDVRNEVSDNGRLLMADSVSMVITEIDLGVILDEYTFSSMKILELWSARYGYLPEPIRQVIIDLYKAKTSLKNVPGSEAQYAQSKALLNSVYGMMVQRPISAPVTFKNGIWDMDKHYDRLQAYTDAMEKAFLNYAWGVYVCAWARYRLREGIQSTGYDNFIYCDTDSVKTLSVDGHAMDSFNAKRIRDATKSGAYADDPEGRRHYMGVFEFEESYQLFRTLGAKRYVTQSGDKLKITIAGVDKEKGAEELKAMGGIEAFDDGVTFTHGGHVSAYFNDSIDAHIMIEPGKELHITRNVCLVETAYKLKLDPDYKKILEGLSVILDFQSDPDYNYSSIRSLDDY